MKKNVRQIKLYQVNYSITDRGNTFPEQTKEIAEPVNENIGKHLKKYRRALDLSTKFTFEVNNSQLVGYTYK